MNPLSAIMVCPPPPLFHHLLHPPQQAPPRGDVTLISFSSSFSLPLKPAAAANQPTVGVFRVVVFVVQTPACCSRLVTISKTQRPDPENYLRAVKKKTLSCAAALAAAAAPSPLERNTSLAVRKQEGSCPVMCVWLSFWLRRTGPREM